MSTFAETPSADDFIEFLAKKAEMVGSKNTYWRFSHYTKEYHDEYSTIFFKGNKHKAMLLAIQYLDDNDDILSIPNIGENLDKINTEKEITPHEVYEFYLTNGGPFGNDTFWLEKTPKPQIYE